MADDPARGRLVKAFDIGLPADDPYCIACPVKSAGRPGVVAFREWLPASTAMLHPASCSSEQVS